jgi:hypothetical protein
MRYIYFHITVYCSTGVIGKQKFSKTGIGTARIGNFLAAIAPKRLLGHTVELVTYALRVNGLPNAHKFIQWANHHSLKPSRFQFHPKLSCNT